MPDSWKLTLPCTRQEAEALDFDFDFLSEYDPAPTIVSQETEAFNDAKWEILVYFQGAPDAACVAAIHARLPSAKKAKPRLEKLPDEDWLTLSQQNLRPVLAGRFYVHTAANIGKVPPDTKPFLIEASQAFGTGGHETTCGCLEMLDYLRRSGNRFDHIADIGTGTGLLAFAAGYLWPIADLTASDIDPVSVRVTAENAQNNDVPLGQSLGSLALCTASGTDHEMIQRRAPYDLVIANILAAPLIELAPSFSAILQEGGTLILAGLLNTQVQSVAKAYRSQGFRLSKRKDTGDWPCLRLVKRRSYAYKRPVRAMLHTTQPPGDFGTW